MKFLTNKSVLFSSLLGAILSLSMSACSPAMTMNTTPAVTIGPSAPAVTSNGSGAKATVTTTPSTAPVAQPVVGAMTPAVVTPVVVPAIANTAGSYANSALLVDTKWMAAHLSDQNLVIIDTRPAANYAAGHISGAINLVPGALDDTAVLSKTVTDTSVLKSAADLAAIFGKAGVSDTNRIVLYSTGVDANAARVFWALEYLGHKDVHILDGGYTKWNAEGNYAVLYNTVRTPVTYTPTVNAAVVATKANELASLNNTNVVRVDSRNAVDFIVQRIPNSVNILMGDYLNADGTVKSLADLTSFLSTKGITPGKTIITNCYVGYRSSQGYFIFRLLGYNVSNYDGSTTEWFADPALPTQP